MSTMKKGELYIVYAPSNPDIATEVLAAVLPDNLRAARGVVCEVVPQLVAADETGIAYIVRVEDAIRFTAVLAPVRPEKVAKDDEPPAEPVAMT